MSGKGDRPRISVSNMPEFMREDQADYSEWLRRYYTNELFFRNDPPANIYHYTTGSALVEIFKSGELWSTDSSCLNDASELLYPRNKILDRVKIKRLSPISEDVKPLLDKITEEVSCPERDPEGPYVACFTEDGDDLSQWRAYGRGEGGYAIEFDAPYIVSYLRGGKSPALVFFGKVLYDDATQASFLDEVIDKLIYFYLKILRRRRTDRPEEWLDKFVRFWLEEVELFYPLIKHPKFAAEREWRLIYHFEDEAIPHMKYLQRNSMMTRHVPLRLMIPDGKPRLPITRIVVGPCRHKDISLISVKDLLSTHNYSPERVTVTPTNIPYQAV